MRLWKRIARFSSQLSARLPWQALGRGRRITTSDPQSALIRDLTMQGTPMSLASVKAALDATTAAADQRTSQTIINRTERLHLPTGGTSTKFV